MAKKIIAHGILGALSGLIGVILTAMIFLALFSPFVIMTLLAGEYDFLLYVLFGPDTVMFAWLPGMIAGLIGGTLGGVWVALDPPIVTKWFLWAIMGVLVTGLVFWLTFPKDFSPSGSPFDPMIITGGFFGAMLTLGIFKKLQSR